MSVIGPGSLGAMNLAGSVAGVQVKRTDSNEVKAIASGRKFQIDQQSMEARNLDDVSETEYSADRDPDGHRPFQQRRRERDARSEECPDALQSHRPADIAGELGNTIDFEA